MILSREANGEMASWRSCDHVRHDEKFKCSTTEKVKVNRVPGCVSSSVHII